MLYGIATLLLILWVLGLVLRVGGSIIHLLLVVAVVVVLLRVIRGEKPLK